MIDEDQIITQLFHSKSQNTLKETKKKLLVLQGVIYFGLL